jgi:hypothetical protein
VAAARGLKGAHEPGEARHICRIDGSNNLLAGLLRGFGLSPGPGRGRRMGQATLYLPATWPTRAAAAKRGRRRLAMNAIGQQMDPHGLQPAAAMVSSFME